VRSSGFESSCNAVTWEAKAYVVYNKVRELIAVKVLTYLIVEYHRGRLQSTPLGKLCTDTSA